MANSFTTQPIYIDTDTTAHANWRGASAGAQLGNVWGFRPNKIVVGPASSAATVAGSLVVSDPANSAAWLTVVVPASMSVPIEIDLSGANSCWRDWIVTGATAAKVASQIFYRD
jgi:hypothetical protein